MLGSMVRGFANSRSALPCVVGFPVGKEDTRTAMKTVACLAYRRCFFASLERGQFFECERNIDTPLGIVRFRNCVDYETEEKSNHHITVRK